MEFSDFFFFSGSAGDGDSEPVGYISMAFRLSACMVLASTSLLWWRLILLHLQSYHPERISAGKVDTEDICSLFQAPVRLHSLPGSHRGWRKRGSVYGLNTVEQVVGLQKGCPWAHPQTPGANRCSQARSSSQRTQKSSQTPHVAPGWDGRF